MLLSESHQFSPNNKYYNQLDHLCFLSKNLYNATLYAVRQHYFKTQQYLSYTMVNYQFTHNNQPDYRALPAKVAKMVQRLVDSNFRSFFALLKNNNIKVKIPKYLDKINGRQIVHYTKQALSFKKEGYIKLSCTDIYIKTKIDKQYIQAVRIIPCNGYIKVEILYNHEEKCHKRTKNYAAIDLGINNLMTITFTNHKPIIINGKPLKSINQYSNKKIAHLQNELLIKNNKYISKRIQAIYRKRDNKINDYLHKAVNELMNQLVTNNISTLILGYNKNWKQDINLGKVNNQNFVQIPFYKLKNMIEYKCKLYGIKLIIQEESYTSKCSFLDRDILPQFIDNNHNSFNFSGKRIKRGLYQSNDGILINADVNGSYNIMKKVVKKTIYNMVDLIEACSMPYKLTIKFN